ncbi:tetratricopeptide repeat-containing sensor histidine kinase [Corallibacter vietnamensis]|uniref:tetratricopeptide repeat-containing sensor histidine kinase n=1 Tax=Corallibacter vietnamensis TaxID=904130 RepID=UPI0031D38E97
MKIVLKCIIFFVVYLQVNSLSAQRFKSLNNDEIFTVRGSVTEKDTRKPIAKVNIEVNGGAYTTTNIAGDFRIQVKYGDELIIRHKDFNTIYYTINSRERIDVIVEPAITSSSVKSKYKSPKQFNALIDSALVYLKSDAEKSIQFVTEALAESKSVKQNSEVYEVLGDVNAYWKQYDLAISNYRISLNNVQTNEVKLKLAKAYELNGNYQESIELYNSLEEPELSNWQITTKYEGLADVYLKTEDLKTALNTYKKALEIAKDKKLSPKITDLNSKIAQAYEKMGATNLAESFYKSAMSLASQQSKKRAVEEKEKVAEFQSKNNAIEAEIALREEVVKDVQDIEKDSIISNDSPITIQKQNYKIGTAYAMQNDYEKAIPYLKKSIEVAEDKEDLVIQKDATRKLSEVYRDAGDYNKALSTAKVYERLVDELYIKKEQEIIQAARFSRDLANKQNRIMSLENERQLAESKYQLTAERNKRQKLVIYSLIGGLVLLLVTAYFMFKYIKQQRLANNLLALKSLRSQMNPHFIFNALNSVNSFIATNDERTANKYLSDFSTLMRTVLENSEKDFIPLEKEIELLELYTKLEHFRFQDKFDYSIIVNDNVEVEDFQIPPMLLQPYIENAVWHGLRYKTEKGLLQIVVSKKTASEITITITDNGVGRARSRSLKTDHQKKQKSTAMNNIKKRVNILNTMYKDKVDVFVDDLSNAQDTGTKVVVTLRK